MAFFKNLKNLFTFGSGEDTTPKRTLSSYIKRDVDPLETWEILEELGDGAFGKVHKARNKETGKFAALKTVPINDQESLEDFSVEIDILSECKHKNVVDMYEAYFYNDTLSIYWKYHNIMCSSVYLNDLDSIKDNTEINRKSAFVLITNGETDDHLAMWKEEVMLRLLEDKWLHYAGHTYWLLFMLTVFHLICMSMAIYTRPSGALLGPTDPQNIVRYICEIIVCLDCVVFLGVDIGISLSAAFNAGDLMLFWENLVDSHSKFFFNLSCVLIILVCLPLRLAGYVTAESVVLACITPLAYGFLLFFARASKWFGYFVVMVSQMFRVDILRFMLILFIFDVLFAKGFYFLFQDIKDPTIDTFRTPLGALMQVFHMRFGEYKYEEYDYTRFPVMAKLLFAVFALLVPILLLNMLVAIMGTTYRLIKARSKAETIKQLQDENNRPEKPNHQNNDASNNLHNTKSQPAGQDFSKSSNTPSTTKLPNARPSSKSIDRKNNQSAPNTKVLLSLSVAKNQN